MKKDKWEKKNAAAKSRGRRLCGASTSDNGLCGTEIKDYWWWPWCKIHIPIVAKVIPVGLVVGLLAIFADLTGIYSFYFSEPVATKKSQSEIQKDLSTIDNSVNEIKNMLEKTEESVYDLLMNKYPLGYAIFYMDGRNVIFRENHQNMIEIDWSETQVLDYSPTKISFSLPGWLDKNQFVKVESVFQSYVLRKAGYKARILSTRYIDLMVEYLFDSNNGAVVVIGFSKK